MSSEMGLPVNREQRQCREILTGVDLDRHRLSQHILHNPSIGKTRRLLCRLICRFAYDCPATNLREVSMNEEFYFVCDCGAKWFAMHSTLACPRCGRTHTSTERHIPPWRVLRGDSKCDCRAEKTGVTLPTDK